MEEFGDQTQAQENLKKAAVLQAVTETQKKWEERLLQVEKEQDAEVALLESQNQEAAKKLNQVSEQSGQLRQELKSLKEERDGLQGKLNSLKENEAQWKKQASDEKTTNDRLKGDMNVLDQQVTLLEAKLSAYAEIMTRTDRLAVGKRIQESRTVEGIQEALRRVAPSLQESAGEATPIVRRSQAPLQEQIEVGPQDPQGIGISPKEFEKLM
jgi:chromosome segregation ATPase